SDGRAAVPGPRTQRVDDLTTHTRAALVHLMRTPSVPAGLAWRARIILLAADGTPLSRIGQPVDVHRNDVRTWLDRFRAQGLDGLCDRPRPGRPRLFSRGARTPPGAAGLRTAGPFWPVAEPVGLHRARAPTRAGRRRGEHLAADRAA